jgi:hypothetical protein
LHAPSTWHYGLMADYWALNNLEAPEVEIYAPHLQSASIVCSGVFGLGTTREQDVEGLARLHDALVPGGVLVLDNEESEFRWRVRDWNEPSEGEISLCTRIDAVDAAERTVRMTIRATTEDDRSEEHAITIRQWYRDELEPALYAAGFADVDVSTSPVVENTLVYLARRE